MHPTSADTSQLITGIRSSDPATIKHIYQQYYAAILHLVETNQGTKDDAQDVFQEGLMVLFQKTRNPEFSLSNSFLTYFYAVCRNIWSNKLRRNSRQEVTLVDTITPMEAIDDALPLVESEAYFLYRKMFLRLGADCQKVLRLFLRKVRMEKIMEMMGYGSVSYAKKRKFICKEKLVAMIKKDRSYQELRMDKGRAQ